jgi:flavin reductase (DIM6/NTAB) family NADH-FMN oxidoreductase RutF
MGCRVIHTLEIGLHSQFIGEVLDVKVDEAMLTPAGRPDVDRLGPVVFTSDYRGVGARLERAFGIGK